MGDAQTAAQKRRIGIWTILAVATVLAVIIGLFVYWALYEPRPPTPFPSRDPFSPTFSPQPTVTTRPSFSPTITPQPTEFTPASRICSGRDDNGKFNAVSMEQFINERNDAFYFVEVFQFRNGDALTQYETEFLRVLVEDVYPLNDVRATVEFILKKDATFGYQAQYDYAIVSKFPSGRAFENYLNADELNNLWRVRDNTIEDSFSWATSLNGAPRQRFTGLLPAPQDSTPTVAWFSAIQLDKDAGFMDEFDQESENAKSRNTVRSPAWFRVESTCVGSGRPYQQVRVETAPSMNSFNRLIQNRDWVPASRKREISITDASFTTISNVNIENDLYTDPDGRCGFPELRWCSDFGPFLVPFDPATYTSNTGGCDFFDCPCDFEPERCNDGGDIYYVFQQRNNIGECRGDCNSVRQCQDQTLKRCQIDGYDYYLGRDPHDGCNYPECRQQRCPGNARVCPDGRTVVSRALEYDCNFDGQKCFDSCLNRNKERDYKKCGCNYGNDGNECRWVTKNPNDGCRWYDC